MKRWLICLFLSLLMCIFGIAHAEEQEPRYLKAEETSYIRWSIEKYGETKFETSQENGHCTLAVDVLPWTKWELKATLVTVPEDQPARTEDVTAFCTWTSSTPNLLHNELNHVSVHTHTGAHTLRAKYTDADGNTYSASFIFTVKNVTVPDSDEMRSVALLMLAQEGSVLAANKGEPAALFVEDMAIAGQGVNNVRLNNSNVYENSATRNHVIYESLKDAVIMNQIQFIANGLVVEAAHVKEVSREYVALRMVDNLAPGAINPKEVNRKVLEIYESLGCTSHNTVITGQGWLGQAAAYTAYLTGCRAVVFQADIYACLEQASEEHPGRLANHYDGGLVKEYDILMSENILEYSPADETITGSFRKFDTNAQYSTIKYAFGDDNDNSLFADIGQSKLRAFLGNGADTMTTDSGILAALNDLVNAGNNASSVLKFLQMIKDKTDGAKLFSGPLGTLHTILANSKKVIDMQPSYIAGGKGNDMLNGTNNNDIYLYCWGHGQDVIYDIQGGMGIGGLPCDEIYLVNCENCNVDLSTNGAIILNIDIDGSRAITAYCLYGKGTVKVYKGLPEGNKTLIGTYPRTQNIIGKLQAIWAECPVNMQIIDKDGKVVKTLYDGTEEEFVEEYGAFYVLRQENGEYQKCAILRDESYQVRFIGTDEGTMKFETMIIEDESEDSTYRQSLSVPVAKGAVFYPSGDASKSNILQADWNGDGVIDETLGQNTKLSLNAKEITLSVGSTQTLRATVSGECGLIWASSDERIAVVDENGKVTALSAGEAQIGVIADDGSDAYAVCTVRVPEAVHDAKNFSVSGLNARYAYTGKPIEPELTVKYKALLLAEGKDYTLTYHDHLMPGTASVVISGVGTYSGSLRLEYTIYEDIASSVEAQVAKVAAECRAQNFTNDYSKALWLHDWLVYHANYDYTYTHYDAEGVLLYKTGVCQSYTLAYQLLLNAVGIENTSIVSPEMDHTWNLAKLDGVWCHIDCTWDDPGTGGAENYSYFGLNDALMRRDHSWTENGYPACSSLDNYYYLRSGAVCCSSGEELISHFDSAAADQTATLFACYIGSDPAFSVTDVFEEWFSLNNWKYGLKSYSLSSSGYSIHCSIEYTDPWEEYAGLTAPVPCPEFSLGSPNGFYKSSSYDSNGLVLVFGRTTCMNTQGLMDRLHDELSMLNQGGVDVIISLDGAESIDDFAQPLSEYPNFRYAYDATSDGTMFSLLQAVGDNSEYITYPLVFIIDSQSRITYYSSGWVDNVDALVGEAYKTATGHVIPDPVKEEPKESLNASVAEYELGGALRGLFDLSRQANGTLFAFDYSPEYSYTLSLMQKWGEYLSLTDALNLRFAVSYAYASEDDLNQLSAEYPWVTFIANDDQIMWPLLHAVDYPAGEPAYYAGAYLIDADGLIVDYKNGDYFSVRETISRFAFYRQYRFTVPDALNTIESEAFMQTDLTEINLNGVDKVLSGAFKDCSDLAIVLLPPTVSVISPDAFEGCEDVIFLCDYDSAAYHYALEHDIDILTRY